MHHRLLQFHALVFTARGLWSEEILALLLAIFLIVTPAAASTRFETRALYMDSAVPGATTNYTVSLQYMTPAPVGSVDMLFCVDPIPYMPCVTPPGLDVSHATLTNQTGESDFSILSRSTNHIVLTRAPSLPTTAGQSTYTLSGIVNPTDATQAFSIRLKSLSSIDGSGQQIDFGSVRGQVTNSIVIETQVPPMLIFCLAQQVADDCTSTNDTYYTDMGELSPDATLTAQSQMAVGTNASGGFAITASGTPLAAGTNVIDAPTIPTVSKKGTNQFGMNLVANTAPAVGSNPEGIWANAIPSPGYDMPDHYKYVPGDVVAFSPNVSLIKKFTVSYIVNSNKDLKAGVYTTTLTFLASGRF